MENCNLGRMFSSFSYTLHLTYQEILLSLPSGCIQNLISFLHLNYQHYGPDNLISRQDYYVNLLNTLSVFALGPSVDYL